MSTPKFTRAALALAAFCAALPALADTRFQIRRMTRDDVPLGKGQCDIRLQVDNEAEVSVRGDSVYIRTIAGRDARDDGSECNAPLPARAVGGFGFEVRDSRNDIILLSEPSRRTDWAAVVRIRDTSGGEGRYHFRITWALSGAGDHAIPPPFGGRPGDFPRDERREPEWRGGPPPGRGWSNAIRFDGPGRGSARHSQFGPMRLSGASVDIDRSGRLTVRFHTDSARPLVLRGTVVDREGRQYRADAGTDDRIRGTLYLTLGGRDEIDRITFNGRGGRDRLDVDWARR